MSDIPQLGSDQCRITLLSSSFQLGSHVLFRLKMFGCIAIASAYISRASANTVAMLRA